MAAAASWYGPLVDLSAAAGLSADSCSSWRPFAASFPTRNKTLQPEGHIQRTMLEVGDNTRSSFCVSLWSKDSSSTIVARDVLLLQSSSSRDKSDSAQLLNLLRRVAEWILHARCTLAKSRQQVILKNWKERKEKESGDFLSISELLSQSKCYNVNVYASIGKMVLMGSLTSHFKGQLTVSH